MPRHACVNLLVAAKVVGPDVVIRDGSLDDKPAVDFLRAHAGYRRIRSPAVARGSDGVDAHLASPLHKHALLALLEQALARTWS